MKKVLSFILISYFLLISFNVFGINVFDQDRKKFFSFDEKIINGTTGTPLGGFGCGGVKFNAHAGTFAVMTAPPADAYDFTAKKGACFQLYTERNGKTETREKLTASKTNGRPNDDAIWPLHFVDSGCRYHRRSIFGLFCCCFEPKYTIRRCRILFGARR